MSAPCGRSVNAVSGTAAQACWHAPPELRSARSARVNLSRELTRYSSWKYNPKLYIAIGCTGDLAKLLKTVPGTPAVTAAGGVISSSEKPSSEVSMIGYCVNCEAVWSLTSPRWE